MQQVRPALPVRPVPFPVPKVRLDLPAPTASCRDPKDPKDQKVHKVRPAQIARLPDPKDPRDRKDQRVHKATPALPALQDKRSRVGSVFMAVVATNPATLLGYAQRRFPTATGGSTGFTVDTSMSGTEADANPTGSAGGGGAHNNLPPYIVVHLWKRTA